MKNVFRKKNLRTTAIVVSGFFASAWLRAQSSSSNAKKALDTVSGEVSGLFDNAWKVALAIAAVVGIVGAIVVYTKWQQGDPHVTKNISGWIGAVIAFILMGVVLRAMFA